MGDDDKPVWEIRATHCEEMYLMEGAQPDVRLVFATTADRDLVVVLPPTGISSLETMLAALQKKMAERGGLQ